ncbi:MAG: hypothetical protein FWC39_10065 [Bacteroidetes bacterium]|nr:hypothetical protein [Bacteroidota bacterium]
MNYILFLLYSCIYAVLVIPVFAIGAVWNKKMREGLFGRLSQGKKIREFARANRSKDIIFIHSSSVGEWEQSIPIIKALKQKNDNIAILASFFSPSGMRHAKKTDVDCAIYLPFDILPCAQWFFKTVKPKMWIISKYDVWAAFVYAAYRQKIPVYLCSAELAEDSTRYKGLGAVVNRLFYKYIDIIFPVSAEYRERFLRIFPFPERLIIAGDARYDQIITKAETIGQQPSVQIFSNPLELTIIAGSLWQADEKHFLPALFRVMNEHENVQAILVPHELHETHLQAIEQECAQAGFSSERFSQFSKHDGCKTRIAIIDTIGMLASLYKTTDIAFVGGAFSTGVHNVAEPAVFGNPVLFGPRHVNSHEAVSIEKLHGGFCIHNKSECYEKLSQLIDNEDFRKKTGAIAQQFIMASKGATQVIVNTMRLF